MMGGKGAVPEFVSLNILVGARERHDLSSNSLLEATRIDLTLQSRPLLIGSINRPLNCLSFFDSFPCVVKAYGKHESILPYLRPSTDHSSKPKFANIDPAQF